MNDDRIRIARDNPLKDELNDYIELLRTVENAVCELVPDAEVRVAVRERALSVTVASRMLPPERLPLIRRALERRIPEIGRMIDGGLLTGIEVHAVASHAPVAPGTVKVKKIER